MTFLNDKNELTGYDIEVGRFIANHLGVKLDLVRLDWKGILPGLQTGRFDVVFSKQDAAEAAFSAPGIEQGSDSHRSTEVMHTGITMVSQWSERLSMLPAWF